MWRSTSRAGRGRWGGDTGGAKLKFGVPGFASAGDRPPPWAGAESRLARWSCGKTLIRLFEICSEVPGRRRAPAEERVLRRMILGAPRSVARDLVDVAEILGEAVPRIAQVVKEIG